MQAIILARSHQWHQVEEFLLDNELLPTDVLSAKPTNWSGSMETHRLGIIHLSKGNEASFQTEVTALGAQVFFIADAKPVLPLLAQLADNRSLSIGM